MICCCCLCW